MIRTITLGTFVCAAAAVAAGCSTNNGSAIASLGGSQPPNAAALATPFAPLSFNVVPYGPQIVDGYQCYVGILTSESQFPSSGQRAAFAHGTRARSPQSVFVPADGCDDFPVPSPIPTPPPPGPAPLASTTFATAQITGNGLSIGLPGVAGWGGTLTFPACSSAPCDAGTSNGSIALNVLPSTTSTNLAFSLVFTNTGPENLPLPTPPPSVRPAPHMYNLYGPVGPSPQPTPTYVSGAPVTIGFPALAIAVPVAAGNSPAKLVLTITQKLTPPVYEEAIFDFDANGNPITIPLTSTATYTPSASNATMAYFTLPSTPFPFQTDFTEYDFTLTSS